MKRFFEIRKEVDMGKRVLIVGSGGREHALAYKIAQSPRLGKLFVAPGNGGTSSIAENVSIKVDEIDKLVQFAKQQKIDLTIASQDDSLALGIVNRFQANGLRIFGPTREAMRIESSKVLAKKLMRRVGVPTAHFRVFTNYHEALDYIDEHGVPIVIKASGLARGKGAYVCRTIEKAYDVLDNIMRKRVHGDAGNIVVMEDCLGGPEASIHAFCDGKDFAMFPSAQDHKPVFVNGKDEGDMTGGMGAIAPVPWFSPCMMKEAGEIVVRPIMQEMSRLNAPFSGCLYPGLKITPSGMNVLEFNGRPGDPEMQVYMRLLRTDLLDVVDACIDGTLSDCKVEWYPGYAVCIVMASGGYPGQYKTGFPIFGIEAAENISGVKVFHAGTKMEEGILKTSRGRVLNVTAVEDTLKKALETAYDSVSHIHFEGMYYRHDIGDESLAMMQG